jgi:type I restriction enzyme S subunit
LHSFIPSGKEITYGVVKPGKDVDKGVRFVRAGDLEGGKICTDDLKRISPDIASKYQRSRLEGGEVLLTIVGRVGETAVVPNKLKGANVARAVAVIPIDNGLDAQWVHRAMQTQQLQRFIRDWCNTTVQPTLNLEDVKQLPIPLPSREVRETVVDILGALDDKIELNRRMNETLEEMAQTLYRHWFVDFGPFQDREFKDTEELGPIPKGWEVKPLESIVTIELDNIDPQDFPDEEFDYYSFSAYDENRYPKLEVGGEIGSRKSLVKRRKVMVSRLNPGDYRIWTVYPDGDRRGITSTEFIHFVPNDPELWGYLNCHLRSEGFKAEFRRHASGTTGSRQRVRRRTPNDFGTVIPSEDMLETFGKKVNPVWDLIHFNREENQTLAETRDYLLPKLISGEIEVEAAQEIAEDTVEAAS